MKIRKLTLALSALALAAASFAATAADVVFNNATTIAIPTFGQGNPYPSTINVAGLTGNVGVVRVTLNNLSHTFADDLNVLLVAPNGAQVLLMSDAGGAGDYVGATLTFSPTAVSAIPNDSIVGSGTYLPSIYTPQEFPAPAPANAANGDMSVLNGPGSGASGIWSLYVFDDASGDVGQIAGGWTLTLGGETLSNQTCASEGYTGTKLEWCRNICEKGYTGDLLAAWIHRWTLRYRALPYCAVE